MGSHRSPASPLEVQEISAAQPSGGGPVSPASPLYAGAWAGRNSQTVSDWEGELGLCHSTPLTRGGRREGRRGRRERNRGKEGGRKGGGKKGERKGEREGRRERRWEGRKEKGEYIWCCQSLEKC